MAEANIVSVTSALAHLEGVIDQKITAFKRDLAFENEKSLSRIAKPVKSGEKHEFKQQGNEEQFDHQTAVKDDFQNAFDALVSSKFVKTKVALEEGMTYI